MTHIFKTGISEEGMWDDLRFPATQVRQGATLKPDYDTTDNGLLFPQNDPTEIAYIIAQMPHEWQLETGIRPHIHFIQKGADTPTFKMDFRWYKNGDNPPAWNTITANSFAFTYTSGNMLQIATFPEIDGTGIDTVSSILDIKIYRDDNLVSGDVLLKEFDIHYLKDALGSIQEFIKE